MLAEPLLTKASGPTITSLNLKGELSSFIEHNFFTDLAHLMSTKPISGHKITSSFSINQRLLLQITLADMLLFIKANAA